MLQQAQQQMVDRFPLVIAVGQSASVLDVVEETPRLTPKVSYRAAKLEK